MSTGIGQISSFTKGVRTMTIYSKTLLLLTAVMGLVVSEISRADFRDYNYKAWADRPRSSRSVNRSRTYRAVAPTIVRSDSAPIEVAKSPTEQRSFSYDPAQPAGSSAANGCGGGTRVERGSATAQRSTRSERSYSYEPSTSSNITEPVARSYSVPRMQSSRSSATPRFLLPKTDPRKYRN